MTTLSRTESFARDSDQAAALGYVLVQEGVDDSGQSVQSWGRDGLTSTLERSDRDGWVLYTRDERGWPMGSPTPVGVAADHAADVLWALIEQDKPRFYRWRPATESGHLTGVVATLADSRNSATIYRIDERWFLSVTWCRGVTEYVALPDSWSAGEALVHGDLAMYRSEHGHAGTALTQLQSA